MEADIETYSQTLSGTWGNPVEEGEEGLGEAEGSRKPYKSLQSQLIWVHGASQALLTKVAVCSWVFTWDTLARVGAVSYNTDCFGDFHLTGLICLTSEDAPSLATA